MKRRDFVKYTSQLSFAPLLIQGVPLQSFLTSDMVPLINCSGIDDRILVVVFLKGGNDGMNTLVPIHQYDDYINLRPAIGLPDTGTGAFVNLDSNLSLENQVGIHPNMTGFKTMYENGMASVIQGVGYPDSNASHFKSTDLWLTGGDGTAPNFNIESGWMGRYLEAAYPGLVGSPTESHPDPIGIQLGDRKPSLGYYSDLGNYTAANLTKQDPAGLYSLVQSVGTPNHLSPPISEYGNEIAYIMSVENSMSVYAQRVTQVFNNGSNSSVTYPDSDFARQLKTIARLISGGSQTKIFLVHTSGFDTHAGQVQGGSPHLGTHANLLSNVFNSLKAFHDDLGLLGQDQRVVSSTFSEFGRKMSQNGSLGTDHGNFAPMFLFGQAVESGVFGTNVDLTQVTESGTLFSTEMQFDYRQIFRTLIQDWLGGGTGIVTSTQFNPYPAIPGLIDASSIVDPSCYVESFVTQTICRAKVYLEGYYLNETGRMSTQLANQGLVPLSQPYKDEPYVYTGTESVTQIPEDVVDWVYLELRDANDVNSILGRRAAFLRDDGQVVGLNGGLGASFSDVTPGDYYVAIFHRSHLAIVSHAPTSMMSAQDVFDFTTAESQALGSAQLKLVDGVYTMRAGDFDGNGIADQSDFNNWQTNSSKVKTYSAVDGDGNGVVNNQDYNLWKRNENDESHPSVQL